MMCIRFHGYRQGRCDGTVGSRVPEGEVERCGRGSMVRRSPYEHQRRRRSETSFGWENSYGKEDS